MLCLLFTSLISFAQKKEATPVIRLHGQIKDWKDRRTIYYSVNGESFSSKNSFVADKNLNYRFDLSKTAYKKISEGRLMFSFDSTTKTDNPYACAHTIDIGGAIALAKKLNKTQLDLLTDLPISFHCEETVLYGAEGEAEKFAGMYVLTNKDTTWNIQLQKDLFNYTATKSPANADYTNNEWGSWDYNAEKGILKIHTSFRRNQKIGIMIQRSEEKTFEVITSEKGYTFKSKDGSTLQKLR